ncbi:MAG: hypothetical protein K2Y39_12500 [Candidatus Obscuribacterales bacterium]|nr:hypothetical protein [Candidatus Obscuribacterales bacterium]
MKRVFFLLLLALFILIAAKAEAIPKKTEPSIGEIDSKIAQLLTIVNKGAENPGDQGANANQKLVKYLKSVLSNPKLITASLPKAKEANLTKLASSDGNVCFYSWDSETGGSMHFFHDFVQWKTPQGARWLDLNPPGKGDGDLATGYFYHDLHSVVTKDGKTVYMPTYRAIYSHPIHKDGITAYTIEGNKLVETPFFKTKTKLLKTIDVPATEVEWNENGLIKFKEQNKTLLIPITVKEGGATGRFLTYRFDGKNFVFDESAHEKPE